MKSGVLPWAVCLWATGCAAGPAVTLPEHRVALGYRSWDGTRQSLADHRGSWLLVHVLATWSGPALLEVPRLDALHRLHAPRLQVLALVVDPEPMAAEVFRKAFDVSYLVGTVEDPTRALGPEGPFGLVTIYPTSILIDPDGRIRARQEGMWDPRQLKALVRQALEG